MADKPFLTDAEYMEWSKKVLAASKVSRDELNAVVRQVIRATDADDPHRDDLLRTASQAATALPDRAQVA